MRTSLLLATAAGVAAAAAAGALTARRAAADPIVLAVDGDHVLVGLGGLDGVGAGATLELDRDVVAHDPVTGATLRDRFPFGALTVVRAGDHVCEAQPDDASKGRVRAGDPVELRSPASRYQDPWTERVTASRRPLAPASPPAGAPVHDRAAAERAVAQATEVEEVWRSTLGKPPRDRVALWQAYLGAHPDTPYAQTIGKELASLQAQADALDQAAAAARAIVPGDQRRRALARALASLRGDLVPGDVLWSAVPARVRPGEPIAFAFAVPTVLPAGAAWLYVRPAGALDFTRVPLVTDGDAYLRATVGGDQVRAGALEWFVEIGDRPVGLGLRDEPRTVAVDAEVAEPPPARARTSIETSLDYVDFDGGLGKGFDQYRQADLAFTYRFLTPVHAVRLGFGTMTGKGGPKDVIDADPTGQCLDAAGQFRCRQVDFSYVYTEVELRPQKELAFMLRPQAGLLTTDRSPDGMHDRCRKATSLEACDFYTGLGFRARVRFGDERGTNLELGVGFTSHVGSLFEAAYHWTPAQAVPIKLAVQVTDMPVPEDYGVRLVGDVGWRGRSWVYPSLRISYQARDLDHTGLSGGLGVNFDW
ncbi:MAG TPA: hypothetical protein VHE35_33345 [Kofleriaceae bacterium]|nr:hypothetical protein [Kofleriaceae bacterium]